MRAEKELRDFMAACDKVADWGMSKGPCPLEMDREAYGDDDDRKGCCAECSFPAGVAWVLNDGTGPKGNGQQELIRFLTGE